MRLKIKRRETEVRPSRPASACSFSTHIQAESGAYSHGDYPCFPRRRPFICTLGRLNRQRLCSPHRSPKLRTFPSDGEFSNSYLLIGVNIEHHQTILTRISREPHSSSANTTYYAEGRTSLYAGTSIFTRKNEPYSILVPVYLRGRTNLTLYWYQHIYSEGRTSLYTGTSIFTILVPVYLLGRTNLTPYTSTSIFTILVPVYLLGRTNLTPYTGTSIFTILVPVYLLGRTNLTPLYWYQHIYAEGRISLYTCTRIFGFQEFLEYHNRTDTNLLTDKATKNCRPSQLEIITGSDRMNPVCRVPAEGKTYWVSICFFRIVHKSTAGLYRQQLRECKPFQRGTAAQAHRATTAASLFFAYCSFRQFWQAQSTFKITICIFRLYAL